MNKSQVATPQRFKSLWDFEIIFSPIWIVLTLLLLGACNPVDSKKTENNDKNNRILIAAEEKKREENRQRVNRILGYLPSPIEAIKIVEQETVNFDEHLLHKTDMASNYLTTTTQALNLGIYGADLSYIKLYKKVPLTSSYLKPIFQLSEELGIPEKFTEDTYKKIESHNISEKESLEELAKVYETTEDYLRSSNRSQTAALLVTGGWIEGMYLACELMADNPDKMLRRKVAEQKYTLEQIIYMLQSVDKNRKVESVLRNLQLLRLKFKNVHLSYVKDNLSIDSVKHKAFWQDNTWTLNDDEFEEIRMTLKNLRETVTK